jgi:hypothetical protein
MLDLNLLRTQVRATARQTALSIAAQKRAAEEAAFEARRAARREMLERQLSSYEMDHMRFRWLVQHIDHAAELRGLDATAIRRQIDHWIAQECAQLVAARRSTIA